MNLFVDVICRSIPDPHCGAEIGVSCGASSEVLLQAFGSLHLYMVDAWASYDANHAYRRSGDGHSRLSEQQQAEHKRQALAATAFAADRRTVLHTTSMQASWKVADGSLDFAVIDGDHTYGGVMMDLHLWAPKVRTGGLLMGHDWSHPRNAKGFFGVNRAVEHFANDNGRELRHEKDVWWYLPSTLPGGRTDD